MKFLFFIYYEHGQTLEQVTWIHYGVFIPENIKNLSGHGLEQCALADPALSRWWDKIICRGTFQLQSRDSVSKSGNYRPPTLHTSSSQNNGNTDRRFKKVLKDENIIGATVAFCQQSSGRDIELILTERHHCEKVSW